MKKENKNQAENESIFETFKKIAIKAAEKRKGKKFTYDKEEFYEQYEKRLKRAGL